MAIIAIAVRIITTTTTTIIIIIINIIIIITAYCFCTQLEFLVAFLNLPTSARDCVFEATTQHGTSSLAAERSSLKFRESLPQEMP